MMEQNHSPEEILNHILAELGSGESGRIRAAITELDACNYSSPAIVNQLEQLALQDDEEIRKAVFVILNTSTHRYIRARLSKLDYTNRKIMLDELETLQKQGLIEASRADVIKLRYNFDKAPLPAKPIPVDQIQGMPALVKPAIIASKPESVDSPLPHQPVPKTTPVEPKPVTPAAPRRTLTEALLSETSIKIALYLGAFFVIASAAIIAALLGATFDLLRIPLLIFATIIFGGVSVAIRKRLPQPSFAFFIVFSFLLPITANVIEQTLNLSAPFSATYWVFVSTFMALIWAGSTWLYESRLFSITAFISFVAALYRVGDIFDAAPEFYPAMLGLASLAGLLGVWALKKWRDANFALPLFLAAQFLQVITLVISVSYFFFYIINESTSSPLWNLASVFTWGFAFLFYALSDLLFPFLFFPWLAAGTLFAIPWFIGAAFKLETLGETILFLLWGFLVAASSEAIHRFEKALKYSLPVLLVSIVTAGTAMIYGFANNEMTGFFCALGVAIVYAALHIIRPRGWLWAFALLDFIIAYFAFFNLPFIQKANIFFGYQLLGLSLLFLLPDLFLKNDFKADPAWRFPPRIYGALFTIWSFFIYSTAWEKPLINTAIVFGIYALFLAIYALRYNMAMIGYIATTSLAISVLYAFNHFDSNFWLESLSVLSALYFFGGFALRRNEVRASWRTMLEVSGLTLGSIISLAALFTLKENSGWFIAIIGTLFIIEMYSRKQNLFEIGAHIVLSIACYLILRDFHIIEFSHIVMGISLVIFSLDMFFTRTFKDPRPLEWPVKGIGGVLALTASVVFMTENNVTRAAIGFAIYTAFFSIYTAIQRKAIYGYLPAAYLPLTIFFTLDHFNIDAWLPALTGLAVLYFIIGLAIRQKEAWSSMLRNSALVLGTLVSLGALITFKETGGWYALAVGLLFAAEMYLSRDGWFEIGVPAMFNIGAFLILRDLNIDKTAYHLLAYSLVWLGSDLISHIAFKDPRPLKWIVRGIGALLAIVNFGFLFFNADTGAATVGFGIYTLFFLTYSLLYREPNLFYAFTLTLPLFITFLFREFDLTKWIHPVIVVAMIYYALGYYFRLIKRASGWDSTLLFSGLGLGLVVSFAAPILGGLDAAIPVAFAATLWAVEATWRKNAWIGFPANGLYLLAYFIILFELKVDQPQFFSMGAALLGMIQHYLLIRAESKTGAFIMGMVSQLTLLGTTYIQMVSNGSQGLIYFVVLFFQSIAVLVYGIIIRSRSLTFMPIFFLVVGVLSVIYIVVYELLEVITTIMMVGCTGLLLLVLGIVAVLMRERISKIGERMSDWKA